MIETGKKWRLFSAVLVVLVIWAGLAFRLFQLQVGKQETSREQLTRTRNVEKKISGSRGRIFDRKGRGNVLALDIAVKDVIADPRRIYTNGQVKVVAARLSPVLEMTTMELEGRLNRPKRHFERLKRFVPDDTVRRIQALGIPEIYFSDVAVRQYPQNSFMCHVIGYANSQGIGSCGGVEQVMNGYLRGKSGKVEMQLDAARREIYDRRVEDAAAVDGADVYLTIDQQLQYFVEKALDRTMTQHKARGAWAIVQSVRTGEILAMASRPAFNVNEFDSSTDQQRLNRTLGVVYEPGSTMKALTLAGVFNEKMVKPSDVVFCENGAWLHAGKTLRDTHRYGQLTVADIIKKSSNIGTAKLALMLGQERFAGYLSSFGIGSRTGVDLPGEEYGILHSTKQWSGISCSRIAIGQGVAVTALQMLSAYCTIANDGIRMRPHVVKRVVSPEGVVLVEQKPQELGRPITRDTARLMSKLLQGVTEDGGTGIRAQVEGFSVAGKTGSAQKPVAGGYSSSLYVASFVGFLPAEKPEIGIIVVVDEPQPCHVGGVVAAPAFSEIAASAVRYLDIVPARPPLQAVVSTR
ncbi:MAG: penicillin-binding protein 2 [bacterium]